MQASANKSRKRTNETQEVKGKKIIDIKVEISRLEKKQGAVLRWQRNRTGRPLSLPQIHQKIS